VLGVDLFEVLSDVDELLIVTVKINQLLLVTTVPQFLELEYNAAFCVPEVVGPEGLLAIVVDGIVKFVYHLLFEQFLNGLVKVHHRLFCEKDFSQVVGDLEEGDEGLPLLFCEVLPEVEQHGEDGPQFIVPDLLDLAVALSRQDLLYFPACFSGYGIGHSFVFRTIS
jgi:hypothetical protein